MFERLRIAPRLALAFGAVLTLAAAAIGVAVHQIRDMDLRHAQILAEPLLKERTASDWYRTIDAGSKRTLAIALSADPSLEEAFREDMKTSSAFSTKNQELLTSLATSDEEKRLLEAIVKARAVYLPIRNRISEQRRAGNHAEALRLANEELKPATATYMTALQAMVDHERATIDREAAALSGEAHRSMWMLAALGAAIVAAGAVFSTRVALSVIRPLRDATAACRRVAEGDLTVTPRGGGRDEVAALLEAMGAMTARLRTMLRGIEDGASQVDTASAEIAGGNDDLSRRTEQRSIALQQSAANIARLDEAIQANAASAGEAQRLAAEVTGVATRNRAEMQDVVATMGQISASAKRIADISTVIDGIAFQTNILALNAAVESARAGEHGKGFAVVAAEVRALAQRSARSSLEIRELIQRSTEQVGEGERTVAAVDAKNAELLASVERVAQLIDGISTASVEQARGIDAVNQAVSALEQSALQDSALVEESAAAAASLREQAAHLKQASEAFRT